MGLCKIFYILYIFFLYIENNIHVQTNSNFSYLYELFTSIFSLISYSFAFAIIFAHNTISRCRIVGDVHRSCYVHHSLIIVVMCTGRGMQTEKLF